MGGSASRLGLGGDVAFGGFYVAAEEEFFHFFAQELARLGVEWVEAVFVDQHGLMSQPLLPRGFGDFGVDALAERAGPGGEVQTFGVDAEFGAVDGAAHDYFSSSVGSGSAISRVRTGAGRPSAGSSEMAHQRKSALSAIARVGAALSNSSGWI